MKNVMRKAFVLILFAFAFAVVPAQAQVGRIVKPLAKTSEKVIVRNGSKAAKNAAKTTVTSTTAKEATSHAASSNKSSVARTGAAAASKHVTSSNCPSCSGRGYFTRDGMEYKCQKCNGTGKRR